MRGFWAGKTDSKKVVSQQTTLRLNALDVSGCRAMKVEISKTHIIMR